MTIHRSNKIYQSFLIKSCPRSLLRSLGLIGLLIGLYVLANFIAIYRITSYGYTLSLFKSSEHYQKVKYYQDKWNVPVWVGEFIWETHFMPENPLLMPTWIWTSYKLSPFRYLIDESMVRTIDEEGWGWSYWEYEKVAFSDEKMNQVFSKYMKGSWKPNDPIPKLTVKGKEIQTEDGRTVILKGPSLPLKHLAYYSELEVGEEPFRKLDSMGANVVRLVINLEVMRPKEEEWNQKFFDTLKQVLDLAEKHHIYVILDIDQYHGSSYFGEGNKGFPQWYVQRYSGGFDGDWEKFNQMWITKQHPYEDSWEFITEAWKRIINVSKGRNIVAGYDLFDEPPGEPHDFYEYLSAQIEPLDPGKIHFAETMYVFTGMKSEDKPKIHNLVLSPHLYDVWPRINFISVMFIASTLLPVILVVIFYLIIKVAVSRL